MEAQKYDESYFSGEEGVDYQASKRQFQLINQGRLDFFERVRGTQRGRMLEIGSALGFFMEAAEDRGWKSYGVEISKFASDISKKTFADRVFCGPAESLPEEWTNFDLAAAFHVFEHLEDPGKVLGSLASRLTQGAWLLFEVPDFGSRKARKNRDQWQYFLPGEHLQYYTRQGLQALLQKHGFELVASKKTSFTRLLGGVDKAGLKSLREYILKYLRWLSWIKKAVLALRSLFGGHDCILVVARKKNGL